MRSITLSDQVDLLRVSPCSLSIGLRECSAVSRGEAGTGAATSSRKVKVDELGEAGAASGGAGAVTGLGSSREQRGRAGWDDGRLELAVLYCVLQGPHGLQLKRRG